MSLDQESVKLSEFLVRKGFKKEDLERMRNFIIQNFAHSNPTTSATVTTISSDIKSETTNNRSANHDDARKVGTAE